jgi:branched-chain amino acid transport system permease protein
MIGLVSYLVFFGCIVLILGTMALGLNLQWGYTGLFNAGIVGFYAIGAYTHAILTAAPRPELIGNLGLPWLVGIAGAMATTAFAAWIVGLATIRLRGDYLAISTFGIAIAIQLVTLNWEGLTGGVQGLSAIPRPLVGWFETPFGFNLWYFCLLLAVVGAVYWALERILRSPWGRVLKAIREDETAAIALGKSAQNFRLQAFVLGSMLMGLSGALYVSFIGFVSPFDFLPILTFQIWAMVIVGGSGNNKGALLGAFTVWAIWAASGVAITKLVPPAYAAQGGAIQVILIGLLLVGSLLLRPRGLIGEDAVVSRHANDPEALGES